jgi:hypothetical protein
MNQTAPTEPTHPAAGADEPSAPLTYGPASSLAELQHSFALVYQKYQQRQLVERVSGGVFFGLHHLLPQAVTLVGTVDHTVFTTLTVVMDSPLGLPLDAVFGDELEQLRRSGAVLGELGLFADRRRSLTQSLNSMHELFRLGHWFVESNNFDFGVVGVHPRHAAFYQRLLGFRPMSEVREHPTVRNAPAVLLACEQAKLRQTAERSKYVRQWLQNPVHESVWEQRYRPSIPDLVALTSMRDAPEMLDELLPFHRSKEQLAAERQADSERVYRRVRKAG